MFSSPLEVTAFFEARFGPTGTGPVPKPGMAVSVGLVLPGPVGDGGLVGGAGETGAAITVRMAWVLATVWLALLAVTVKTVPLSAGAVAGVT